jgi:hypothetical protein
VSINTPVLHVEQHRHQRLLDFLVEPAQRRQLPDPRPERAVEPQRDVGILGRILTRALDRHRGERQLLRALARHVLVVDGLDAEVVPGGGVEVVSGRGAVEHVGLEHRVKFIPRNSIPKFRSTGVVLEVMSELRAGRVLEQGFRRASSTWPRSSWSGAPG